MKKGEVRLLANEWKHTHTIDESDLTPVTIHTFTFSYMEFRDGYMDKAEANTHAMDLLKKAGYPDKKIHGLLEIKEPAQ